MKLLSTSSFMLVAQVVTASTAFDQDDGFGFEEVAPNIDRDENIAELRSFLRAPGPYHNISDDAYSITSLDFSGYFDDDDDDFSDDFSGGPSENFYEDFDEEDGDNDSSRRLQTTPGHIVKKMSNRDEAWLKAHNDRRKKYHSNYNKDYIPLMWSPRLKKVSKVWANKLAKKCKFYHDPNNKFGENLAYNSGSNKPSPDSVLYRFVEKEEKLSPPDNYHFTQVLWRATEYVVSYMLLFRKTGWASSPILSVQFFCVYITNMHY